MKAMTRYARTAMTGAQNAGRMEVLHDAQDMGIKVKKKWLATLDKRTRDTHADLDGQVVDVDEPFVTNNGHEIMYPGDPSADPSEVYNCRCTMVYVYPEYPQQYSERRAYAEYTDDNGERHRESYKVANISYNTWKEIKHRDNLNALHRWRNQEYYIKAESEQRSGGHVSDATILRIADGKIKRENLIEYDADVTHGKAVEYLDVTQAYSGNEHVQIRAYQQGKVTFPEDIAYLQKREKSIEEFIEKATTWDKGRTYRAIGLTDSELSAMIENVKNGKEMDMLGTASWSSSNEVALEHQIKKANRVIFVCDTQAKGTSIMAYSNVSYEYEVLVSKKARYKPLSYKEENGVVYIMLEEL